MPNRMRNKMPDKTSGKICPACGSSKSKFVFSSRDRYHGLPGSFKFFECGNCGALRPEPRLSGKRLARHYPDDYYSYQPYKPGSVQERISVFLYRTFFSKLTFGRFFLRILLFPFLHLLRGTRISKGARLLDVGCGNGSFMYKMQLAGMDVHGCEYGMKGVNSSRKLGLDVRHGFVEQQKYPSGHFDVVTLNHVFEHVPDPAGTLAELKRISKKDGITVIQVPNAKSLARHIFGECWASLETPRHLTVFTPKSLRMLAGNAGLKVRRLRHVSFPWQFQVSLAYLLNRHSKKALGSHQIANSRLLYFLFLPLVYAVDFLHIGDIIEVTLEKAEKNQTNKYF